MLTESGKDLVNYKLPSYNPATNQSKPFLQYKKANLNLTHCSSVQKKGARMGWRPVKCEIRITNRPQIRRSAFSTCCWSTTLFRSSLSTDVRLKNEGTIAVIVGMVVVEED
jgi:hypothetical protein